MRRTYGLQSFSSPESDTSSQLSNDSDQSFVPNLEYLHQLQESRLSADCLFKILDAAMVAQRKGMKQAMAAINPSAGNDSDWKFINCFLDSTVLLLEACNNIQLRLGSIRNCLDSIPIGLHYLESKDEPSKAILQQAATTFMSCSFRDKRQCSKMEKNMSRMRKYGKKLNGHAQSCQETNGDITPELFKALTASWEMAVLAIELLSSATSIDSLSKTCVKHLKVEPQKILLNAPSNEVMEIKKKAYKPASMEELRGADLASQTLLRLILAWQKGGGSNLRRMAVKAVAGELKRRKEVLEKTLPLLEDKIKKFYQQIVANRISLFGMLPETQKEERSKTLKCFSYEESQREIKLAQYGRGVAWDKVKTKVTIRSSSLARIKPRFIDFIKNRSVEQY